MQEGSRKEVERLYGTLYKQFKVALHPARHDDVAHLIRTVKAVCIMNKMVVDAQRPSFVRKLWRNGDHVDIGGQGRA